MSVSDYPVIGQIKTSAGAFPLLDLPQISDERWQQLAKESADRRKEGRKS